MIADYGARILAGGLIAAPANPAYAFGTGDFSVTILFETTQPGALVASKADHGQQGGAGWLVVLQPGGRIKFATDNGWGYYQIVSGPTTALDGSWHSVAAVRSGGQLSLYFDGKLVPATPSGGAGTPVNVSNTQRLTIGNCDPKSEPYRQFVGIVEDVTLWNRGLSADDIWRTMFNKVTPADPGLVGFWAMDQNLADSSPTANSATATCLTGFAPVMHCLWAEAPNAYSYLAIDMHPEADAYGAQIAAGGLVTVPANPAYQFGVGDFSVSCVFTATGAGALVASKSPSGGSSGYAGWLLILNADGSLTFATDDGFNFYLVNSVATAALDGAPHAVAAIRAGGALSIWFDGAPIQTSVVSSAPTPLNVSSNLRVTIGQADQPPARQFLGVIERVTLWNRAMAAADVQAARFGTLDPATSGLVGYWTLNNTLFDATAAANAASVSGAVGFALIDSDRGAQIVAGAAIAIPASPAYQFGSGDFAITCLISATAAGALVTSKSPSGGSSGNAGWLLILNADGSLTFATDDGWGYYLVNSVSTAAMDGKWHGVAAVRTNGVLAIWLDGVALQTSVLSTRPTPLNVSSNRRVLIGQADQPPTRQFVGVVEDVTLWNRAISPAEIQAARFNALDEGASGLVGYWKMDGNLDDASAVRNRGAAVGSVAFVPVAHLARRAQTLMVPTGTAYLYGCVLDTSQPTPQFPPDTVLTVARPDGVVLNQNVSTDDLVVQMDGGSVWVFLVHNPMPGDWTFTVEAPANSPALVSVQTTPSTNVPVTIQTALVPLYSNGDIQRRYRRLGDVQMLGWTWADVGFAVGVTLGVVGAVLVAAAFAPVALLIAAATAVKCGVALGLAGYVVAEVAIASQVEKGAFQIATGIGIAGPKFGGSAQGNATLLLEGGAFLPALRDLLAAVAAGSYTSRIAIPKKPNLRTMLSTTAASGKSVSLLLWDCMDAEHIADNNYYLSKLLREKFLPGGLVQNVKTRDALKGVTNLDVRLESYRVYGSRRWLNSQHQKIAIVKVKGVKAALVGGLNLLGAYWDLPTHPDADQHSWHDASVLVQGPVVDLIEAEFDRRWGHAGGGGVTTGDYAKLAYWMAATDTCLDNPDACALSSGPVVPYKNRVKGGPLYPVDVLITNAELAQRVTQIRDKLIERINAATAWAYFENYTFHDIQLVKALIAKLAATPTFHVVVMLPHPSYGLSGWESAGEFALSRASLAALMLCGVEWTQITYTTPAGPVTVVRTACSGQPTLTLPQDSPIEMGTFDYVLAADGSRHSVGLLTITDIQQTAAARVIAASPARNYPGIAPDRDNELPGLPASFRAIYVHSKLAVFDTAYAIVGSANFAARSLAADGECSIGIGDPTTVAQIQQAVLGHWGVDPTTNNWRAAMAAFVASGTAGMGAAPLTIAALAIAQPAGSDWDMLTSIMDPSYIL